MIRRAAALLAGLLSSAAANADPALPDPTSLSGYATFLRDGGPYAGLVIAGGVLFLLYRRDQSKDAEIRELNKALVAATGKAETVAGAVTNALSSLEAATRATADLNAERWETVKGMSVDLGRVATLVASNGDAIRELKASLAEALKDLKGVVEGLRTDVQGLYRRPHG